jgi:hypothetical protein
MEYSNKLFIIFLLYLVLYASNIIYFYSPTLNEYNLTLLSTFITMYGLFLCIVISCMMYCSCNHNHN